MKKYGTTGCAAYRFAPFLFLFFLISTIIGISGCKNQSPDTTFSVALERIDSHIESGNPKKAANLLVRLQKRASGSRQWLSIIKRHLQIHRYDLALSAASEALARQPANEELSALKAWLLTRDGLIGDAVSFFPILKSSRYRATAAYVGVRQALDASLSAQDPLWWITCWDCKPSTVFLKNAVAISALGRDFKSALEYAKRILVSDDTEQNRLEAACIALDGKFIDTTIELLQPVFAYAQSEAVPLVLSDAYVLAGKMDKARYVWDSMISKSRLVHPLALYNFAWSEPDAELRKKTLEQCLFLFPGYYPAVALYARSTNFTGLSFDPLEKELDKAGYTTLVMEEKKRAAPVSPQDALRSLETAATLATGEEYIKIELERLRLLEYMRESATFIQPRLWNLLEQYPESTVLQAYALSYFTRINEYSTAFALNTKQKSDTSEYTALFDGVRLCSVGKLDEAAVLFESCAGNEQTEWMALANLGLISEKKREYAEAVEQFSLGAERAPDTRASSRLHFEAARILSNVRNRDRAISVLGYALQLDPQNYRAEQLLRQLEAVR